jgi:peptidyl-prolyl cis-trans isomerase C
MFDAVMLRVAPDRIEISEHELEQFFETHRNQFEVPETRLARHILITVNPDFPENRRETAHARMEQVATELAGEADRFEPLARRYSECPSAMEGGQLGRVPRGQLYPELDAMLFQLPEGGISPILESELGFHLLLCEQIMSGRQIPFSEAAPRIRELLEARQRRGHQQAWLAALQHSVHA